MQISYSLSNFQFTFLITVWTHGSLHNRFSSATDRLTLGLRVHPAAEAVSVWDVAETAGANTPSLTW